MLLFIVDETGQPILVLVCKKKYKYFYAAALNRLRHPEAAQDAVQEALLSFLKRARSKDGKKMIQDMDEHDIGKYVMRCVVNGCNDILKKAKPTVPLDEIEELADDGSLEERYEEKTYSPEIIRMAAQKLPEQCKEYLRLSYLSGCSKEEIATRLGIQPQSVATVKMKTKRKLKEAIAKCQG